MARKSKTCAVFLFIACLFGGSLLLYYGWSHSSIIWQHSSLRGGKSALLLHNTQPQPSERRKLQSRQPIMTAVLNGFISVVTPWLSDKVSYAVKKHFSSYDFFDEANQDGIQLQSLGDVVIPVLPSSSPEEGFGGSTITTTSQTVYDNTPEESSLSICDAHAQVEYMVEGMTGVGAITIDSITFQPGSQKIKLKLAKDLKYGAEWSGKWIVQASFPSLNVITTSTLTSSSSTTAADTTTTTTTGANTTTAAADAPAASSACGDDPTVAVSRLFRDETVSGNITLLNVVGQALVTIRGETERVLLFGQTSELASAEVEALILKYDGVDTTKMGVFRGRGGSGLNSGGATTATTSSSSVDVGTLLRESLQQDGGPLNDYLVQLCMNALQEETDAILPRPLFSS